MWSEYMSMNKTIVGIENISVFKNILENNKGLIIIKLGAKWCKPCQRIEHVVQRRFNELNELNSVETFLVDIDDNPEIYKFLIKKKMLHGIPAILMYEKGNNSHICNDSVNNSNIQEIEYFFERCIEQIN
jgi:thiol:disulfide interchange protein